MVALVEEDEAEEEDVDEDDLRMNLHESDHGDKDELTMPDHGTSLVVQRSLKIGAAPSEENCLRSNVFHTKCTSKDNVCLVIIDSGSFKNCFPLRWCKSSIWRWIHTRNPINLAGFKRVVVTPQTRGVR